jgi:hypothetical protein
MTYMVCSKKQVEDVFCHRKCGSSQLPAAQELLQVGAELKIAGANDSAPAQLQLAQFYWLHGSEPSYKQH